MLQRKMRRQGEPKLQKEKRKERKKRGNGIEDRRGRQDSTQANGAWKSAEARCGPTGAPSYSFCFLVPGSWMWSHSFDPTDPQEKSPMDHPDPRGP